MLDEKVFHLCFLLSRPFFFLFYTLILWSTLHTKISKMRATTTSHISPTSTKKVPENNKTLKLTLQTRPIYPSKFSTHLGSPGYLHPPGPFLQLHTVPQTFSIINTFLPHLLFPHEHVFAAKSWPGHTTAARYHPAGSTCKFWRDFEAREQRFVHFFQADATC